MIVGSLSENLDFEKRVAITPEVVKKYKSIGLDVHLGKNYATHLGLTDKEYEQAGASIFSNNDEIFLILCLFIFSFLSFRLFFS